jgi:hypothetical protein
MNATVYASAVLRLKGVLSCERDRSGHARVYLAVVKKACAKMHLQSALVTFDNYHLTFLQVHSLAAFPAFLL